MQKTTDQRKRILPVPICSVMRANSEWATMNIRLCHSLTIVSLLCRPTLDEIRSWGKSFDRLMRSPGGRKIFRDFLRCEYSEENILFWLACEELKKQTNPEAIEEKARFIYEDYISILSPKEVSLDSRVREIVNRNMVEPTPHTFDEAQLQIYTLMHRDSYPRWVASRGAACLVPLSQCPILISPSPLQVYQLAPVQNFSPAIRRHFGVRFTYRKPHLAHAGRRRAQQHPEQQQQRLNVAQVIAAR